MSPSEIESALGLPTGPTMEALVRTAKALDRREPSQALSCLGLQFPWLLTKREREARAQLPAGVWDGMSPALRRRGLGQYLATPQGILPFATAGYDTHFGFLSAAGTTTDDCPIVRVVPSEPDCATEVVAPTLLDLLGLLAAVRSSVLSRDQSDLELLHTPMAKRLNQSAQQEITRVVTALEEGIPGLRVPTSPSMIIRAAQSPSFTLSIPFTHPDRVALADSELERANAGLTRARNAIEAGAYGRAVTHAESAMGHPSTRPRALALCVRAQIEGGETAARTTFDELVRLWLDETPTEDGPHARAIVPVKEMVELLGGLGHPSRAELEAQLRGAPEPPVADGDFF